MAFWKKEILWNKPKKKKNNPDNKIWTSFSKYIRLRDCLRSMGNDKVGRCCSCNKIIEFKGNDAGHLISRSCLITKYDPLNVHLQCSSCNRFGQGKWDTYYEFMINLYGIDTINELMEKKNQIFKGEHKNHLYWNELYKTLHKSFIDGLFGKGQLQIREFIISKMKQGKLEEFLENIK